MVTIRRNLDLEYEWVVEAGRGYALESAMQLGDLARARSTKLHGEYVDDPMTIRLGLDRPKECLEELADAANHALFHMQEITGPELTDGERREITEFLQHLVIAFDIMKRHTAHA